MTMTTTITEALEHSGMENIQEHPYWWTCNYNGNEISIMRTIGGDYFALTINGESVATRCNYRTLIQKIKIYK